MRFLILTVAALISTPALAQTTSGEPSPSVRAMAAGYKALTVCSALNNAAAAGGERTLESVEANELVGIYPELDGLVREMPVTMTGNQTSVAWSDAMPPRVAVWGMGQGCAIMPVGWVGEPAYVRPTAPRANLPMATSPTPAALEAVTQRTMAGGYGEGTNTTAVVVLQDDRLVAEAYASGFGIDTPQRTWSVGKSLAGTIIGAAVHRGETDVNAPAAIADWGREGDPRAAITLDQLMRMASGLTSDTAGNRTDGLYFGGVGVDEQATTWPLIAAPGSRYRYANNDTLLAVLSIAPTFERHPPAELFRRLGMYDTWAETDWRGNYMLSSQVWTTARDLARFGQLYLHDGMVDGERILPEGWRDYVSTPSGPQPTGEQGYGATFWLMNRSEGIPADTISANGNRGQYVIIVPSRNIVIVRRGEDATGRRFDPHRLHARRVGGAGLTAGVRNRRPWLERSAVPAIRTPVRSADSRIPDMADPHTADAHDSHDAYAHGTQEISEQVATFSLFQGLAKWGSLAIAAVLAFLTVWFMPGGSFMAGAIVFVVMMVGGGFFLRSPKSAAH